ncbi:SCO7613 C-terminal domain-containing membrane protein [Nocardiopsis sp. FR4]|uniref:SCO7613 C-terminal domain-containing membrane protein n=2 Tax=unclassified Nocardiopsis TaxID=2649073 RepID=UPI00135A28BF|nr:hypothetical protein [Nocardiopsis sp. FR4]
MDTHGSPPPPAGHRITCPDCRAPLPDQPRACGRCGLLLVGDGAQRLWWIDTELARLREREQRLAGERRALVERLREESARAGASALPAPSAGLGAPSAPGSPGGHGAGFAAAPAPGTVPGPTPGSAVGLGRLPRAAGEVTRRSAQNVILGLGGLLVGIAALVFAVWTWSDMGTGTRAGVLGLTTAAFAAAAPVLYRRGLRATAETFACLAAALLCIDALALWLLMSERFGSGPGYTATVLAAIGALLALYPLAAPLRSPRILTALLCQPVPVLVVASLPSDGAWAWILPALAATALADLAAARWLDASRPGRPVRTLRATGTVLWVFALLLTAVLLLVVSETSDPVRWWALAATLLLSGATGLLLARRPPDRAPSPAAPPANAPAPGAPAPSAPGQPLRDPRPAVYTVVALLSLGAAPLAAGPPRLPVLPRVPLSVWTGAPGTKTVAEALYLSEAPSAPVPGPLYLAAVLVAAVLALGAAALLRRDALVTAAALVAPPTLLAVPLLLGAPGAAAVAWALAVGTALVLGASLTGRRAPARTCATTGTLTLATGLLWSLPSQNASLAALVAVGATALAAVLLYRRAAAPYGPAVTLYATGLVLAALTLLTGGFFLLGLVVSETVPATAWWLLTAACLLTGATALASGRAGAPPALRDAATGFPSALTAGGLLLLPAAPLLAGRAQSPGLPLLPRDGVWSQPASVLLDPALPALGLSAGPGGGAAAATAAGVLLAGAVAVTLAARLDGRRTGVAAALAAAPALVPLPLVLGLPFAVALAWLGAVGAALAVWSARSPGRSARPRESWAGPGEDRTGLRRWSAPPGDPRTGWTAGIAGLLTLLLGVVWTLPQEYANVGALMTVAVVAAAAAALARSTAVAVGATAAAVAATGAFALALPLVLTVPAEYAALAPIAMVAAVAVAAPRLRGPLVPAVEVPAGLWAVASLVVSVSAGARAQVVAVALAVVGVIALATAVRPGRRWAAPVGGLLMFAALWTVLAAWSVAVPEAYTVPPALAALVIGWEWSRRAVRAPSSWSAYGGALALLFLPTVALVLSGEDLVWRVPAVLVLGLAAAVWGLARRLQAVLVTGGLVLVATSLRAFGPPLWDLTRLVPNWVPFAAAGVLLLAVGARYEANLERLRRLGRLLSGMR